MTRSALLLSDGRYMTVAQHYPGTEGGERRFGRRKRVYLETRFPVCGKHRYLRRRKGRRRRKRPHSARLRGRTGMEMERADRRRTRKGSSRHAASFSGYVVSLAERFLRLRKKLGKAAKNRAGKPGKQAETHQGGESGDPAQYVSSGQPIHRPHAALRMGVRRRYEDVENKDKGGGFSRVFILSRRRLRRTGRKGEIRFRIESARRIFRFLRYRQRRIMESWIYI